MSDEPQRPVGLTWDSSREQVLAAVEEADARSRETQAQLDRYTDDDIDWRGDLPDRREGCYWSKDGTVRVHMGEIRGDPSLAAQQLAGEEDQSATGF